MTEQETLMVPISEIFADPNFNCRGKINPMDCTDLANDMKTVGQIHAIMVRPYSNPTKPELKYQVVEGFRRYYAARINNWPTIQATVRDLTDEQAQTINFTENLQRTDLTFMQQVRALSRFRIGIAEDTEIARRLNVSPTWVKVRREASVLPGDVQREIEVGFINQEQIGELYKMRNNPDTMYAAVREIKDSKIKGKKARIASDETKRKKVHAKKHRSQSEIFDMQDYLRESFRTQVEDMPDEIQVAIRVLGWAGGAITDMQLYQDFIVLAEKLGLNFQRPPEIAALV